MSVNLQKGQKVDLTKGNSSLKRVMVGLGWDEVNQKRGLFAPKPAPIDCDASAILLSVGDKLANKDDFVFYNNLKHKSGAVVHMGDNLTGAGDGDDEQILIDLRDVPQYVEKIVIAVTIYQARERSQHFGLIENAFIMIVDEDTNKELCKFNLTDNYSGKTAMIFGEVYRYNGEWKFSAIGEGTNDNGIADVARRYQ